MKKFIYLISMAGLLTMASCQEENNMNVQPVEEKTLASIDNIGEVHNYLLDQMKLTEQKLEISDKTRMKDLVNNFQMLNDNGKYYCNEVMTRANAEQSDFSEFENLEIADFDLSQMRSLVLKRINANKNIDEEVKKVIEIISDPNGNPLSEENLAMVEKNKDKKGGELLIVFKNIASSSNSYWPTTRSQQSRAVMIADAVGGVLGTTCSGVMGIIWGAGFSYAYDKCTDN